jgi:hypothetical protein
VGRDLPLLHSSGMNSRCASCLVTLLVAVRPPPLRRLFLSADPPPALEPPLPGPLLLVSGTAGVQVAGGSGNAQHSASGTAVQACCKVTTEPPGGLKANLVRAYRNFNDDTFEACSKQSELKWVEVGVHCGSHLSGFCCRTRSVS